MAEKRVRVALFVTCLVDLFRPTVGFAAVKLLEEAGCVVEVPRAQTCCGQPAYNSGDRADAKAIALQVIDAFAGYDYVVAPSGSCAGMIRQHYPEMFADDPTALPRAAGTCRPHLGTRVVSCRYLAVCAGSRRIGRGSRPITTPARGCASWGFGISPGVCLPRSTGCELRELPGAEVCCGFGGTFCVKYPDISDKMVSDKAGDIVATGAEAVLAGDLGCLLNIAGKLSRQGRSVEARHVAEVLAGMTGTSADRRPALAPMQATSREFTANARAGLANPNLQQALEIMTRSGFPLRRREVVARLPEFEALRDIGRGIKEHTLAHLDFYLELYEQKVVASGGEVHWARTPEEAREAVLNICRAVGAKTVTKGKSMIAEEVGLNDFLEKSGITPVETDLGEYIIQLRHEPPSHLIAPAMHLVKGQVADTFRGAHHALDPNRPLGEARQLCDEARALLRPKFLAADVGITGANFLIAETGSSIIVTNEGNGDLTQTLPRVHIVMASLEKLVPTFEDAATLLRLLARSATGQEFSSYTTVSTGPRRAGDLDGPEAYHVVLLDNGRGRCSAASFTTCSGCIRCGACHEPLPGLCRGRRSCLWLGLSRSDGRGVDPEPDRHR